MIRLRSIAVDNGMLSPSARHAKHRSISNGRLRLLFDDRWEVCLGEKYDAFTNGLCSERGTPLASINCPSH